MLKENLKLQCWS